MKYTLASFFLLTLFLTNPASARTSLQPWLAVGDNGHVFTSGIAWKFATYDQKWKWYGADNAYKATQSIKKDEATNEVNSISWQGPFSAGGQNPLFQLQEAFTYSSGNSANFTWTVSSPVPFATNIIAVETKLPASRYAGSFFEMDSDFKFFPGLPSKNENLYMKTVRKLVLPVKGGGLMITGQPFMVQIQDRRKHGDDTFTVRLFINSGKKPITQASLNLNFNFYTYESSPLDLSPVANRTFADEVAGDGQGGWTDQGPENDLSVFSPKELNTDKIDFAIPSTGNTTLVLSRHSERAPNEQVELVLSPKGPTPKYLYLLHAGAYLSNETVGTLIYHTANGAVTQDIKKGRDVNDWWMPKPANNAAIAWSMMNESERVGLYVSRFDLPATPVEKIEFKAGGDAIWMIAGASLSAVPLPFPKEGTFRLSANDTWQPFQDKLEIQPGSILDFSDETTLIPAGTFGPVIVNDKGHFSFKDTPKENVRFLGTSLNFGANFLNKKDADELAVLFRRMGYNSVRFHHHDVMLFGGWDQKDYVIDAAQLDKLDYLFYTMKEQGLYITTELYQMRHAFSPEVQQLIGSDQMLFKSMVPFSEVAMNDWKQFAKDLLGHKNPYTGLTWAEDPALIGVCPINEDGIWVQISKPLIKDLATTAFAAKYPGISPEADPTLFNQFIAETQIASDREMRRYLKEELGFQGLVTGSNWMIFEAQIPIRSEYDYVDNHGYWDHPKFPEKSYQLPATFTQKSATAALAQIPRHLFLTKVKGKPFAVTEYNYSMPNKFRSEGGALMGSYAARQDWDALYRFGWSHSENDVLKVSVPTRSSSTFNICSDPINRLSEAFVYVLWLRGDVPPFTSEAVYTVGQEVFDAEVPYKRPAQFSDTPSLLGLDKRISSQYIDEEVPEEINAEFMLAEKSDSYDSNDGGVLSLLQAEGNLSIITPYSKAIVLQTESADMNFISEFSGGPASVLATSRDGKTLELSNRILVIHLTDILAEDMKFDSLNRYSFLGKGKLPHLIRTGTATLLLPDDGQGSVQVFAVAIDGTRQGEVPFERKEGNLIVQLDTTPKDAPARMVYEIIKTPAQD
ncbi:hypothetical protein P3T73_00630 [Kiritimatiellota bacterium B12222]|nr:hypothetical protein P3T73_00630 [Kiritimatiellota bacterium B12222]